MNTIKISTEDLLPALTSDASGTDVTLEQASEPKGQDAPAAAPAPTATGLFERVLAAQPRGSGQAAECSASLSSLPPRWEGDAGAPNDLGSYLQRRASLRTRGIANEPRHQERAPAKRGPLRAKIGRVGPVLRSIDAVLNHVRVRSAGDAPRAVLVAAGEPEVDATGEAIRIARALLTGEQRGVLVDLSRGAAAVSGRLGLPRAPGFTDLVAARVGFEDIVHVDDETRLQVIPAGNPTVRSESTDGERVTGIFAALAQAYDFMVLHVDRETVAKIQSSLEGCVSVVVAVLATGPKAGEADLTNLTAFGCSVVLFEQSDGERGSHRFRLFGRAAVI